MLLPKQSAPYAALHLMTDGSPTHCTLPFGTLPHLLQVPRTTQPLQGQGAKQQRWRALLAHMLLKCTVNLQVTVVPWPHGSIHKQPKQQKSSAVQQSALGIDKALGE
jgi:hypothetical protein